MAKCSVHVHTVMEYGVVHVGEKQDKKYNKTKQKKKRKKRNKETSSSKSALIPKIYYHYNEM